MFPGYVRPIRYLVLAFTSETSTRQLAGGVALGMVVGLVPKGNLTAGVLMALLLAVRLNLGVAMISAFTFSSISPWLDGVSDAIGHKLLTAPARQEFWRWFFDQPWMKWSDLNNTVVLGSLILAALLAGPCYWLCRTLLERYRAILSNWWKKLRRGRQQAATPPETATP